MRLLGVLLLAVLTAGLTACSDDGDTSASDPVPTSASPTAGEADEGGEGGDPPSGDAPTKSPPLTPGGVPFRLVEMVDGVAGRGVVSEEAVPLTSDADVEAFVAGFSDTLADDVRWTLDARPVQEGETVWAAVVALGCDVPPGVDVTAVGEGYAITGLKVANPLPECFAPRTSVALVAIRG